MRKKVHNTRFLAITIFSLIAFVMTFVTFTVCNAQEWSRKGKGEVFVLGQNMSGDTTTGLGITLEVDDTIVGGFGGGYNFNDHLNLNTDMLFGQTTITGKAVGRTVYRGYHTFRLECQSGF